LPTHILQVIYKMKKQKTTDINFKDHQNQLEQKCKCAKNMESDQKIKVKGAHFYNRKGRLTGILLLFCFIAPLAVTFVILQLHKKQVKKEVKSEMIAGLDKEELVLLKFTKEETQKELRWEHPKEFEFKGQMYDLVEKSRQGDTIFYWCWVDDKETKLNQKLKEIVALALGNNQQRKNIQEQLTDFYKSLYWENCHTKWNIVASQSNELIAPYDFSCLTTIIPPPVPPPEIA